MKKLLPIPDLLKKSFAIYRRKWWTLLGISLINIIAYTAAIVLMIPAFLIVLFHHQEPIFLTVLIINAIIAGIIATAIKAWATVGTIQCISGTGSLSGMQYLRQSNALIYPALLVSLLAAIAVSVGFILLIIPGIISSIWFTFSFYTLSIDGKRDTKALAASKQLVKGYGWAVLGRLALMWLGFLAVAVVFRWLGGLVNIFITMPFYLCYKYTLYEDLKHIKAK